MTRVPASASFNLEGKVVIITGASRNIGAALAGAFAAAGSNLVLVARGAHDLRRMADQVQAEHGARVETVCADVTARDAPDRIVGTACGAFGGIDVLINNAYSPGSSQAPVLSMQDSVWDEVLAANLIAPYRLTRACASSMLDRPGANVINVVSGSGFLPSPGLGAYGVSKAALWTLTRYLAAEAAPRIRVNALCPGAVTPTGEPTHEILRQLLPLIPMGRLGRPQEIAGAALYLASDLASYTTGEVLFANGGRPW
jgi:NAD(P)-dependent dehydrogenase (short-subunit alcohol dehydrogenase family)